ncbi:MAG: UPF0182 family protein [Acidimicrobiales bacterium]
MRAPTDMPRRGRSQSGRLVVLFIGAALLFLIVSIRGIAGFYTDYLWFGELSLTSVWKGVLGAKLGLGLIFTVIFFVLLWVNLTIADLLAPTFRPVGPEEQLVERYHELVGAHTGLVRAAVAGLFALIAGPSVAAHWNDWLLLRNRVPFGIRDPQFGRDIGFYVFQLPFLKFVVDWLFASVVIVVGVVAVAHYLNGGIRFQTPLQKVTPQVKAHLSVLLALLALLRAGGYVLQRFELLFSNTGVVQGAGYTDVNARLPGLNLLVVISLFAFALLLFNILRRGWVLPVIAVGLWALVAVVVGAAIPTAVQKFQVQPTESTKELPYIQRNIAATRTAFSLQATEVAFEANDNLDAAKLAENEATIRNARLWDPAVIGTTYERLQTVRNFYQFNDVDVDRYEIDGRPTQVLISARELNSEGVPSASWVNRHLVYTHGYGAVVTPSSGVTSDGKPALRLKDLPPEGLPALDKQPSLYYGQGVADYAIVNTKQKEIDYTEADGTSHTTTYTGGGGVKMDSVLRRAALALRFGDLNPFISSFVTTDSRAMYVRDIDERVRKLAPFLRYDADPYPVITDGRIVWVYDAYTVTDRYPYSQQADTTRLGARSGLNLGFNYVRNSVKVVIDAYSGQMTLYVVDAGDPIVKAYQKAFPKLFTPESKAPADLKAHFRYPEDLFRVQTDMFGLYHITRPSDFYNRTDTWDIAQKPGAVAGTAPVAQVPDGQGGSTTVTVRAREERMEPYYLLMRLPDEEREQLILLQPFVPFSRDDTAKILTGFMVAKSDRSLKAYTMPRSRPVDGPALVNARINQETEVSEQRTLLGKEGSQVELGNLLALPIEQSLLWVQPLYVKAEATPLPQLKRVIVVFGNRVVMRESLTEALTAIFGSSPPTLEEKAPVQGAPPVTVASPPTSPGVPSTPSTPPGEQTVAQILQEATAHFKAAQAALRNNDLGAYQRETDAARALVARAAETVKASAAPPVTPTTMRASA